MTAHGAGDLLVGHNFVAHCSFFRIHGVVSELIVIFVLLFDK
jgi:hypothetical protein